MFHNFVYFFFVDLQMNEFKTAPDFSTSIGSLNERNPNSTTNQGMLCFPQI
jgi:hypothetical protein